MFGFCCRLYLYFHPCSQHNSPSKIFIWLPGFFCFFFWTSQPDTRAVIVGDNFMWKKLYGPPGTGPIELTNTLFHFTLNIFTCASFYFSFKALQQPTFWTQPQITCEIECKYRPIVSRDACNDALSEICNAHRNVQNHSADSKGIQHKYVLHRQTTVWLWVRSCSKTYLIQEFAKKAIKGHDYAAT